MFLLRPSRERDEASILTEALVPGPVGLSLMTSLDTSSGVALGTLQRLKIIRFSPIVLVFLYSATLISIHSLIARNA
ncbi:hypothetical protein TNCV_3247441 [Trichonephila clavipes]|nr:hypothetical protein TNCV_3247441 [Trichonephila clavipes]